MMICKLRQITGRQSKPKFLAVQESIFQDIHELCFKLSLLILLFSACCGVSVGQNRYNYVDMVYPQLDTHKPRWILFSSASRPFGMVNLSPDTYANGDWGGGYNYERGSILFFSHIHGWNIAGVPVLPTTGKFKGHLGKERYASKFSHTQETIKPGYHSVFLETYGIKAELTSTVRVGFHRYQFPASNESYIPKIPFFCNHNYSSLPDVLSLPLKVYGISKKSKTSR